MSVGERMQVQLVVELDQAEEEVMLMVSRRASDSS
jgi:hypothetical protein